MNGLEVITKVYKEQSIKVGTKFVLGDNLYEVVSVNGVTKLKNITTEPLVEGEMIHDCNVIDMLDFLNSELREVSPVNFAEAARRNRKLRPINSLEFPMSVREALAYLSTIKDNKELKRLLEEEVWCTV